MKNPTILYDTFVRSERMLYFSFPLNGAMTNGDCVLVEYLLFKVLKNNRTDVVCFISNNPRFPRSAFVRTLVALRK